MRDIGGRLQARARELGLTDSEVARRFDLAQNRYSAYVNGRREPDLRTFARICAVLRISPGEALGLAEEPRRQASAARTRADFMLDGLSETELALAGRLLAAIADEVGKAAPAVRRSAKSVAPSRARTSKA